ncbi:MAG: cobalt ECF transporter T component CbiQ [Oscillospiraceae bacterium]|jgi:cobalt/nickel transport system permease protein|nr:cobalt ECF transporter T component CbiQ [Oscillospiraceae bacterium]
MQEKIRSIATLEDIANGDSALHRMHPGAKLICLAVLLSTTISFPRTSVSAPLAYLSFISVSFALADIPLALACKRLIVALPFAAFGGISNLIFDRAPSFWIGRIVITNGALSCASLILRALLCVSYVVILMAVTPLSRLTAQLRRIRVPEIFVRVLEMTYRYIGVLLDEAAGLTASYRLRALTARGVRLEHAGILIGGLFLRTADRAERVHRAMLCRGEGSRAGLPLRQCVRRSDVWAVAIVSASAILFRIINIPEVFAHLADRVM